MAPTIALGGPAIICAGADIRQAAFLRGRIIVGERCVVGNSCELKNVILFDGVQVPHYNYVGDSILGYKAHMGAGSITSNVKSDKTLVMVHAEEGDQETGLKKFGAMLGDGVEVGCNSVLNPGTVIDQELAVQSQNGTGDQEDDKEGQEVRLVHHHDHGVRVFLRNYVVGEQERGYQECQHQAAAHIAVPERNALADLIAKDTDGQHQCKGTGQIR